MSQADTALSEIRDQIDDIDRQMQGLLIQRAALADEVSAIKAGSSVNIRPSREADILRRLVSRHQGPFSKKSLVRIWREIFSAMLRLEGSFSVALYQPDDLPGYWDMARDQYGTYTPLQAHHSPRRVIESVMRDDATLGVLPYPSGEDEDPWWRTLAAGANTASRQDSPKVVAKLPFAGTSSSRTRGIEALVIAKLEPEPSGKDRSLLAIEIDDDLSATRFQSRIAEAGFEARLVAKWNDPALRTRWVHLMECAEFVPLDDPRLDNLETALGDPFYQASIIGSYAVPLTEADLEDPGPPNGNGQGAAA